MSEEYGWTTTASGRLRHLRRGSGRTVVLLHTLRTQLEYFGALLGHLAGDVDVLVPDLPGHGESDAPAVAYSADFFIASVEQLLDAAGVADALVVGESIGGSIALALAARDNPRVAAVIAVNPYDYGRWGGIRRSSPLANLIFTMILWPGVGPVIAGGATRGILRAVLSGGLVDTRHLPDELVETLHRCGRRPGHARALRSLSQHWRTWISARAAYPESSVPVTLVYGDEDWSRPSERHENATAIPGARTVALHHCGHFASLDQPSQIAAVIRSGLESTSSR